MASCGPSNALQNLKAHVERDASLQREGAVRPAAAGRGFRAGRLDASAGQFEAFNSFDTRGTQFARDLDARGVPMAPSQLGAPPSVAHGQAARVGYMNQGRTPASEPQLEHRAPQQPPPEWAAEFQSLSRNDAKAQPAAFAAPAAAMHDHMSAFPAWSAPAFHAQPAPFGAFAPSASMLHGPEAYGAQLGAAQLGAAQPDQNAMEAAFREAEESLRKLHLGNAPAPAPAEAAEAAASASAQRGTDASSVAASIISKVNERADPELVSKVQGSKFMNLMTKLRNHEVEIESEKFVSTSTHSKIGDDDLAAAARAAAQAHSEADAPPAVEPMTATLKPRKSAYEAAPPDFAAPEFGLDNFQNDWPPQRETLHEQPPETRPEPRSGHRFSRDLDDPETYLFKMKQNLDPRLFEKSPYTSSFKTAQELAPPQAVPAGSWDENYEDW